MSSTSVVRIAAAVAGAVGLGKYLWILADSGFDVTVSPWGFLLLFVLPFVVVLLLAPRRPRAAAWVMIPFGLATLLFMVVGIAQSEYTLEVVLVAYPVAIACAVGVIAAVRTLVVGRAVAAH